MKAPQPNLETKEELRYIRGLGRWSNGECRKFMDARDLLRQYIAVFPKRERWGQIDKVRCLHEAMTRRRLITNPPGPDNAGGTARESAISGNVQPGGE